MGIKEIKPSDGIETQFPPLVRREGIVYYPLGEQKGQQEDLEKVIESVKKRQVLEAERKQLLSELKPEGIKPEGMEGKSMERETNPKRYLVDPESGAISVDEEGGEYTYKDALLVSASIKGKRGEYDSAIQLITALKELSKGSKPEEGEREKKAKEWYVDDDTGIIVHDPENGEMTLSEARTVSQSRQRALVPRTEEIMTPEKLELMKRDIRDETNKTVQEEMNKLHKVLAPKDEEQPFSLDSDGKIELNPKARLGVTEFMLYQLIKNQQQDRLYKDNEGNVLPLPGWLEVRKFDREQKRLDEKNAAITTLIEEGKKQLPKFGEALKNMATSKETAEAMKGGGWLGEGEGKKEEPKQTPCAHCHKNITYSALPSIIPCPHCGELNILGSSEQREQLMTQLGVVEGKQREEALSKEAVQGSITTPEGTVETAPVEQSTPSQESEAPTAYCMKCKAKVVIKNPSRVTLKNGRLAVQGTCPNCDTKLSRMA